MACATTLKENADMKSNPPPQTQTPQDDEGFGVFEVVETEHGQSVASRGVYLAPNLITTLSLLSAFFAIIAGSQGRLRSACFAIFLSAILDGMDGRVARLLNAQSPFGEQYDSLADMVAFGLAPALLIYHFALAPLGRIGIACAFIYVACAAFRLARFNVQIGVVEKKYFIGLASPLAALLVTSAVWTVGARTEWLADTATSIFAAIWVVVCGLLMVSNIKYFSFKEFDRKKVPFVALVGVVFLLGLVLYDVPLGILSLGIIYALSGFYATWRAKKITP